MAFRTLRLSGFRGLKDQEITLGDRLNLVVGDNASGKTSLVEAIDLISRGRSFRAPDLRDIASWSGTGQWSVVARRAGRVGEESFSVRYIDGALICQKLHAVIPRAELARAGPSLVIGPDVHRLAEAGPGERRTFLDWALFHVEQPYLLAWRHYRAALRQRNASLRQGRGAEEIAAWDPALAHYGMQLDEARRRWVARLEPAFVQAAAQLQLLPGVSLKYQSGWSSSYSLMEALARTAQRSTPNATTLVGPHRADLQLMTAQGRASMALSRGQQKVFLVCLVLALVHTVGEVLGQWPLLVIDDWHAELSESTAIQVMELLREYPGQRLLTGFLPAQRYAADGRLFHVEQGKIHEC